MLTGRAPRKGAIIRVWRFLLSAKTGDVASYSEIAAGVGAPRAIRAAADACGANRLAMLAPCHRGLRANGELGSIRNVRTEAPAVFTRERAAERRPGANTTSATTS
jgi:AraC family transcriptional regulator of adaptative response/methylated-DNA-[protein]-cysteine methyltransferase